MQPFQCDLQPQLQERYRTTKTGTTNRCKHIGGTFRAWNDSSRTRRTDQVPFFASCSHFTRKNTRLRTPASSPKHNTCNIHAAITMRSCNQKFKNRIELRTQEEPLVAKHIGGTIKGPQPRHRRGTFLRRLQLLYTEKHTVSCPGVLTKKPMPHSCSYSNAICNHSFKNRIELRTQEQQLVGKRIGEQFAHETTPAAPAEQTRYLSLPASATLNGKTQSFVLRFPPHNITHAKCMQHSNAIMQQ